MVDSGQLHAPATLPPEKRPSDAHMIGGWVDLRTGRDAVAKGKKSFSVPGIEILIVQPVAQDR